MNPVVEFQFEQYRTSVKFNTVAGLVKGGLISERFSLWLKSPKIGAKSHP
jgi:hypothetical protein